MLNEQVDCMTQKLETLTTLYHTLQTDYNTAMSDVKVWVEWCYMFCRCCFIFYGRLSSLIISESTEPIFAKFSGFVDLWKMLVMQMFI